MTSHSGYSSCTAVAHLPWWVGARRAGTEPGTGRHLYLVTWAVVFLSWRLAAVEPTSCEVKVLEATVPALSGCTADLDGSEVGPRTFEDVPLSALAQMRRSRK